MKTGAQDLPRRIDNIVGNPHCPGDAHPTENLKKTIYSEKADRTYVKGTIIKSNTGMYSFSGTFKMSDGSFVNGGSLTNDQKNELIQDFESERTALNDAYKEAFAYCGAGGCDNDADVDGVTNASDNCSATSNPDQRDDDRDGLGNVCDACPAIPGPGTNRGCPWSAVPALSVWGTIIAMVIMLSAMTIIIVRVRKSTVRG